MKSKLRNCGTLFATVALFSLTAAFAADKTVAVGKKGEVVFEQPTQIGRHHSSGWHLCCSTSGRRG